MPQLTFSVPDLTAFCRLGGLGLEVIGQRVESDRAVLSCRVAEPDEWCRQCGCQGIPRGSVVRRLAHEPFGWRPTTLMIRVRRYKCSGCGRVWRQDTTAAALPRAKLSRHGLRWALEGVVCQHLTISRVAESLGVSWNTANTAVLDEGRRVLINDPARFDGVRVIGVDEHVWRHTRKGDKYVTVIIDLTPVKSETGPARLLDMAPGRSKQTFKNWLKARPERWRDGVEVVAMDGFTGFKTAAAEALPDAVEVMDPFHVVQLAGDALDRCRQRVQQDTLGHRGRRGDPLYGVRRILHTDENFLTEKQRARIDAALADPAHADLKRMWTAYQHIVAAYRDKYPPLGRKRLRHLIEIISTGIPAGMSELRKLGHTLKKRAKDILAYFDHPRTSNGPTEAINGRLEHLRGSALGFRNLQNYIARSLLESGGFRPHLHPQMR